uniref:Uncharacterized protein n=1 Tax=Anguilla anguilla TaxID=7936 RepID=A0A0E9XI97_ANGAN
MKGMNCLTDGCPTCSYYICFFFICILICNLTGKLSVMHTRPDRCKNVCSFVHF